MVKKCKSGFKKVKGKCIRSGIKQIDKRRYINISGGPRNDPRIKELIKMDKKIYKGVRMKIIDDGKAVTIWLNKKDFKEKGHRLL